VLTPCAVRGLERGQVDSPPPLPRPVRHCESINQPYSLSHLLQITSRLVAFHYEQLDPPRASKLTLQHKSSTSGHRGSLGEISKQEIETVFLRDEKNVKDKSVE
jgi:hypothetical protein